LFVTNCEKLERDHENKLNKVDVLEKLERERERERESTRVI
jgi:hypothetical protein